MSHADSLRSRLAASGTHLPAEIVDFVVALAGPLVTAQEGLVRLDLGAAEPFDPARRLVDDAAP